jgi:hypothetical protein
MNRGIRGFGGNAFDLDRRLAEVLALGTPGGARNLRLGNAGLIASGTPNSQVKVTADMLVLDDGRGNFVALSAWNETASTGALGPNGLDAGVVGTNAWYDVYAIWHRGKNRRALILTTAGTSPRLPPGYKFSRLLGSVRVDGSSNLYRTQQIGTRAQYVQVAGTNTAGYRIMGSGTAGTVSFTTPTWAAIAVAAFVPPSAIAIHLLMTGRFSGSADAAVIVAPSADAGGIETTSPPLMQANAASFRTVLPAEMMLEGANIQWASTAAGGGLWCVGWSIAP